jgi:hypothetical protein
MPCLACEGLAPWSPIICAFHGTHLFADACLPMANSWFHQAGSRSSPICQSIINIKETLACLCGSCYVLSVFTGIHPMPHTPVRFASRSINFRRGARPGATGSSTGGSRRPSPKHENPLAEIAIIAGIQMRPEIQPFSSPIRAKWTLAQTCGNLREFGVGCDTAEKGAASCGDRDRHAVTGRSGRAKCGGGVPRHCESLAPWSASIRHAKY